MLRKADLRVLWMAIVNTILGLFICIPLRRSLNLICTVSYPMKKLILLALLTVFTGTGIMNAQDEPRKILRGKVLYRNSNVANENVINSTAQRATITNDRGEFEIPARVGDELVFTALNYQIEVVEITEEIMERNRLVVEVNEKVTELDEVVISPENQEEFLQLRNEEFKEYSYDTDPTSEVRNVAFESNNNRLQDGLNFVNIYKALASLVTKDKTPDQAPRLAVSEVLRKVYDDRFFVVDLDIPQDEIGEFLIYVDDRIPARELLRKDNEFQLIDFLVEESKRFRELNDGQN